MRKMERTTIISGALFVIALIVVGVFGYRAVVRAYELPGRLSSVSVAAYNLNYYGCTIRKVQKVSYDTMKYGYMEDLMYAQMDCLDLYYDGQQMKAIRAINDLTAMSEKTADKLAFEKAKAEQEEAKRKALLAARAAEEARNAKMRAMTAQSNMEVGGYQGNGGSGITYGSGDTASRGGRKGEPVYAKKKGDCLGTYVVTAYCTCKICCGIYSGGNRTASGTVPTTNRTIAVDTNVIPFGTRVVIEGQVYVAEDRGGAIKGNRIDMFFYTHQEALTWGRKSVKVYLADE